MQFDPAIVHHPLDVMPGRKAVGAELARERNEIDELDPLIAAGARHRRTTPRIFVDEAIDYPASEAALIIEHIMGDAEPVGDLLCVVNVLAGAASA